MCQSAASLSFAGAARPGPFARRDRAYLERRPASPSRRTDMGEALLLMEGIEKSFPGVHALSGCRFELRSGEVHALVGENGAGKSTLMKVLAGVYSKDAGRLRYKGAEVEIPSPRAAQQLGISMIHQELNLMPHLTVAQNIFIGREPRRALGFLDDRKLNDNARKLLETLRLDLDPRTRVSNLTVATQQMVEIAKALSFNSEVLIMDEPTAALTEREIDDLFRIIRQLRDRGVGVVHISHRLEELKQISDRITVMRDGKTVDTVSTPEASIEQIIGMMVGRTIYETAREVPDKPSTEIALEARGLRRGRTIKNVSFQLRRGEILGQGKRIQIRAPSDAVRAGIAYLSEDRKRYGLALGMDVETNLVLTAMRRFLGLLGWVRTSRTHENGERFVSALRIRTPGLQQRVRNLSGGNQQKVVVGKWLTADTQVLIFDEPTRGIDVGAKSEIYRLLNDLAKQGKSIIMISSELPELLRMSHRILVMCEGRITGELPSGASQEEIMRYATQRSDVIHAGATAPVL